MVRVDIKGWFTTYKTLKSGERREYHYHRVTLRRLNGKPGSPEFIADYATAEKLIRDRLAGEKDCDLARSLPSWKKYQGREHESIRIRKSKSPRHRDTGNLSLVPSSFRMI